VELLVTVFFAILVFGLYWLYGRYWQAEIIIAGAGLFLLFIPLLIGLMLATISLSKGDVGISIVQLLIGLFLGLPAYMTLNRSFKPFIRRLTRINRSD